MYQRILGLLLAVPALTLACRTFTMDYETCNGYNISGGTECRCSFARRTAHSGILFEARGTKYVVTHVLSKAAATAGVRIGDTLVGWDQPATESTLASRTIIQSRVWAGVFEREGHNLHVVFPIIELSELLADRWNLATGFNNDPEVQKQIDLSSSSQFTIGLLTRVKAGSTTVAGVLAGGPADEAGIRPGDILLNATSTSSLSSWQQPDGPTAVNLSVLRGRRQFSSRVTAIGISAYLRRLVQPENLKTATD